MKQPQIIELPKFLDTRGNLSFIEQENHIPFIIRRTYWLYDVPGGEARGGHAYRENQEFIVALSGSFDVILDNIKAALEKTPPELAADIFKNGLYLTGGASQVCHLAQRLSNGVGLNVNIAENPIGSVAIGLSKIIKEDQYKALAYGIEEDR